MNGDSFRMENAIDNRSWLPPGQVETRKFPIVGESTPCFPSPLTGDSWNEWLDQRWRLEILDDEELLVSLNYPTWRAMSGSTLATDIHCVTGWSQPRGTFTGIPLKELLDFVGVTPPSSSKFIQFVAYSSREHDTSLPLEVALAQCWLVHSKEGKPLLIEHGFPCRVVTIDRYFYKSLKWIHRIHFRTVDRLGFWERASAYHNRADPWREERFSGVRLNRKELEEVRNGIGLHRYCREQDGPLPIVVDRSANQGGQNSQVIIKADLRGWNPPTNRLEGLQCKACDLRGADLSGKLLRGANLTLCDLRQARMVNTDLQHADLEGAKLVGADLTGANLEGAKLTATQFVSGWPDAPLGLAGYSGLRLQGATGLLEDQQAYLSGLRY